MMFYIVSYDIPDDIRRNRISRELLDFGTRVQLSVFECILDDDHVNKMIDRLKNLIKEAEDSIRIYSLCADCLKKISILGQGMLTKDEDIFIV